jgi:hypothetical protein
MYAPRYTAVSGVRTLRNSHLSATAASALGPVAALGSHP